MDSSVYLREFARCERFEAAGSVEAIFATNALLYANARARK